MKLPIRWRLTAAFAIVLALVLAGLGVFVLRRSRADAIRNIDTELRNRATAILEAGAVNRQLRQDLLGVSDEHFGQELDASGSVVAASAQLRNRPIAPTRNDLRDAVVTTRSERRAVRLFVVTRQGRTLLLATALDDETDELASLRRLLTLSGLSTVVVGTALAWLLAGAALRPVDRLRAAAAEYSSADLSGRLTVPDADDELRRLAVTLNEMLARIEDSFDRQRMFVDRASHELRTPLSNLALELELALRRSRDADALRDALTSAAEETDRLQRLASNLLVFARSGDVLAVGREPVAVLELARATGATFAARAAAAGVELGVEGDAGAVVAADPVRVRQALTNLLDNALRVSPAGGIVAVRVVERADDVVVSVGDAGPGFPADLRTTAFAPFVRGPSSGHDIGAGLGLAIVAEVARAHGGQAWIEDVAQGATVAFSLPRHPESAT